jgi:hypothetical protein
MKIGSLEGHKIPHKIKKITSSFCCLPVSGGQEQNFVFTLQDTLKQSSLGLHAGNMDGLF